MMDWNWFFSAIAQSAAAISGIFGAFIVTKILTAQAQFSTRRAALRTAILESQHLGDSDTLAYISWFVNEFDGITLRNNLIRLLNQAENEGGLKTAEEYYQELDFSGFADKQYLLEKINKLIDKKKHAFGKEEVERNLSMGTRRVGEDYWPARNMKTELIRRYILEVQHQVKQNKSMLAEAVQNPESSGLVTYSILSILVLFFIGVIYPLSFLPLAIDAKITLSLSAFWNILFSLKGIILISISIIFSALLIVFLVINAKLKHQKDELDELEKYTKVESFNVFLFNMVANKHLATEIGLAYGERS